MKDEEIKLELMKLLGITDKKVADKVIYYAKAVNDGTANSLLHTTKRKKANESLDNPELNDLATAKALNLLTIKIINAVANAYQEKDIFAKDIDIQNINKSYILLSNELNIIYKRNKQLNSIYPKPTWQYFDIIEGNEWAIKQYIYEQGDDTSMQHNAQVNKLCIIAGVEIPKYTNTLKQIITMADESITDFQNKLLNLKRKNIIAEANSWYIPEYKLTYDLDGKILINDVLTLKKISIGSSADKLMDQALNHPNDLFIPDVGQTARNLSTILSSMGFSGIYRDLFFPIVNKNKGVLYRPVISRETVFNENLDTYELDARLKELGAYIKTYPMGIPF